MLNPLITKKAQGTTGVIVESKIPHPSLQQLPAAPESNILVASGEPGELMALFAAYGEIQDTFEKQTSSGTRFIVQFVERSDAVTA